MKIEFDWSVLSDKVLAVFVAAARCSETALGVELSAVLENETARRAIGAGRCPASFELNAEEDVFTFGRDLWAIGQAITGAAQVRDAADANDLIASAALFRAIGAAIQTMPPPSAPGGGPRGRMN